MTKPSKGRESIRKFVHDYLIPKTTTTTPPLIKLNIRAEFRNYLIAKGTPELEAEENAEKWECNLKEIIFAAQEEWSRQGVPCPFGFSAKGDLLIGLGHPKWGEITNQEKLPPEFNGISAWLHSLSGKEFLVACSVYLKLVGCDPIYITDGSGDGGIDLIGLISQGPLRSHAYYIQSKTSKSQISRDMILLEYGKYASTLNSHTFREYENALKINASFDGTNATYLFISNNEFKKNARSEAKQLRILLRSGSQLAFWFSQKTTLSKLRFICNGFVDELERNLSNNISKKIDI